MKTVITVAFVLSVTLFGCQSEPTMQKYFVDKQQQPGFSVFDVPSSIINTDKASLTPEQKRVLKTFKKLNVMFYKADPKQPKQLEREFQTVRTILKDTTQYAELMHFGSGKEGGSISIVGEEDKVDEIVLFGSKSGGGLTVIRILGEDMNPADAMTFLSVLQNTELNMQQLQPLQQIFKP